MEDFNCDCQGFILCDDCDTRIEALRLAEHEMDFGTAPSDMSVL